MTIRGDMMAKCLTLMILGITLGLFTVLPISPTDDHRESSVPGTWCEAKLSPLARPPGEDQRRARQQNVLRVRPVHLPLRLLEQHPLPLCGSLLTSPGSSHARFFAHALTGVPRRYVRRPGFDEEEDTFRLLGGDSRAIRGDVRRAGADRHRLRDEHGVLASPAGPDGVLQRTPGRPIHPGPAEARRREERHGAEHRDGPGARREARAPRRQDGPP